MNELETHVNHIVASIAAEPARKLEILRELLMHMRDALDEEELRAGSAEEAIDTALSRLGDPDQLQREIQNSIPFSDVLYRAFRRAVLCLAFLVFISLPQLLIATFDGEMPETGSTALLHYTESVRLQTAPLFAAQFLIAANVFLVSLLHYWLSVRSRLASRPILGSTACVLATMVVALATGSLLSLLTTGGVVQSWEFCVRWGWIALAVSLAVPLILPLARHEIDRYRHWQQCSILAGD